MKSKSSGSGHGEVTVRTLSKSMVSKVKSGDAQYINIGGKRVKVTKGNIHPGGNIKWYVRSDTKKIALCRPGSDKKRKSKYKPHGKREPYTGDTKGNY